MLGDLYKRQFQVLHDLPQSYYNNVTFAALATMFALYQRDMQGGEGQMIDLALYEPTFRITANMMPNFFRDGEIRERIGNRNPTFSPAGTFETKDGKYVQIAAGGDNVFQRLAEAMGMPVMIKAAAGGGRLTAVEELLARGVVDLASAYYPLFAAAMGGHLEVVKALIAAANSG